MKSTTSEVFMRPFVALGVLLLVAAPAQAEIAEECKGIKIPDDYDEVVQQDFLNNYYALVTALSPIHGPIPHQPGHGAIGLDLAIMPPLSCEKRFALNHTKTEDTNKTPVIPRPRATLAFPAIGKVVPYIGAAYVPPIRIFGTTNVIISTEIGAGIPFGDMFQLGARFHNTIQKTIGDVATAFDPKEEPVDDLYIASTVGLDVLAGFDLDIVTPYVAAGITDVSTFFYVGDDAILSNNYHPYFGPAFSLGVDGLLEERFRFGAEFYAAPGGYSLPELEIDSVKPATRYGRLYTGRIRLAVEL